MVILLSDIVAVTYTPEEPLAYANTLSLGDTKIVLKLKNGHKVDATKPIPVRLEDGTIRYLKIPNPCNHKPEITFVETAVARLARGLLLKHGVLIPEYEICSLPLHSSNFSETSIHCCLIEELIDFRAFDTSGNEFFNADPALLAKAAVRREEEEAIDAQQRVEKRAWQMDVLLRETFAAYLAGMYFIANNDTNPTNFGKATTQDGMNVFAAIDFDMAPMPFLVEENLFGPFNAVQFNRENRYHKDEEGRFTPAKVDVSRFPHLRLDGFDQNPDYWITNWVTNLPIAFSYSPTKIDFNNKKLDVFNELIKIDRLYFSATLQPIVRQFPMCKTLMAKLGGFFSDRTRALRDNVCMQIESRVIANIAGADLSELDTPLKSQLSSSFTAPAGFVANSLFNQKLGESPDEMDRLWPAPPPSPLYFKKK